MSTAIATNPFGIRRATPDDYDELLTHALYLAKEDAVQTVSEDRVAEAVHRCCYQDGAIAGIMENPDDPSVIWGTVGLVIDRLPFAYDDHLSVLWLGTSITYRRILKARRFPKDYIGIAKKLVQFARWAADSMGMPVFIRLLTAKDLERKLMSYTREMRQVGATFGYGMIESEGRQYFDQKPVVPFHAAVAAYQHDAGFSE